MSRTAGQSATRWVVAAIVATVSLAAAVAVVLTARQIFDLEAERQTRGVAANAVPAVSDALRTGLDSAARGTAVATRRVRFPDVGSAGISMTSAIEARDTGRPVLDDSGPGVVVVATYAIATPPQNVERRRENLTDLRVVPLRLGSLLTGLRPTNGGISVAGPDRTVLATPGPAPPSAPTYTVPLAPGLAPGWTVTTWARSPGVPLGAWLIAVAIAVAGLLGAAWTIRRGEQTQRNRAELIVLRDRADRLATLAAVSQHSLDLADVLPAVTTVLADALGLRGLTLATPGGQGHRLFFAWGQSPVPGPSPQNLPTHVRAGESLTLVLSRGGRSVARLIVVTGRDLDTAELDLLKAAADLLTSAVSNAEAFSQQRDLLQRMRSLDELKTVFLATASHELRTPVGAISGFARMLATNWDALSAEQARMYADRVDRNAQRLAYLVEDLLDFSRLEQGLGSDADTALLDLGEVVSGILEDQPHLAADHELVSRVTRGLAVRGSSQAVERVVSNLVGNAAKYSPTESAIRVSVTEDRGRAELVVEDDGPGIASSEREQIFSRFYRGSGDAVIRTSGAGLGLAIVTEFAASMGATVSVAASRTGGARFVVSYPLAAAPGATSQGDDDVDA